MQRWPKCNENPKKLKHAALVRGKWKRWNESRRFRDGKARKVVIKMEQGLRTLVIGSTNPDNFINIETRQNITQTLRRSSIRNAAIQEKHIPHSLNYIMGGYSIITSSSTKINQEQPQGLTIRGVPILIYRE